MIEPDLGAGPARKVHYFQTVRSLRMPGDIWTHAELWNRITPNTHGLFAKGRCNMHGTTVMRDGTLGLLDQRSTAEQVVFAGCVEYTGACRVGNLASDCLIFWPPNENYRVVDQ